MCNNNNNNGICSCIGNNWWWIIILVLLFCNCGNNGGYYNCIWQGDANAYALLALELADSPRKILNVTGPELESTEKTAIEMGKLLGKEVSFVSEKAGDLNYLNDASQMIRLFGNPRYTLEEMIQMQAQWIKNGGISIGKPTHFEVSNGKF